MTWRPARYSYCTEQATVKVPRTRSQLGSSDGSSTMLPLTPWNVWVVGPLPAPPMESGSPTGTAVRPVRVIASARSG